MKKETFLKIVYICLSIMLIAITIGWCITGLNYVVEEVKAEEITNNYILNFNQHFQYIGRSSAGGVNFTPTNRGIYVVGTANSTGNYYLNGANWFMNIDNSSIYYVKVVSSDNSKNVGIVYSDGYSQASVGTFERYWRPTSSFDCTGFIYLNNGVEYNTYVSMILVNVTQMFGAGNEPQTIEEIKKILPLNYYGYTTGTAIAYNQLNYENGYNLGYENGLNNGYTYTNSVIVFKNLVNNFEDLNTHKNVNAIINDNNNITYYSNAIATGYLIPKNRQVVITWDYITSGVIMELDNGEGTHFELDITEKNYINSRYVYSFSSSENGSLVFYNYDDNEITINNLVVYVANDEQLIYDNGYYDGFKEGKKAVDTQSYYDKGFEDGKQWHINHDTGNAWGSSWDFITNSFNGVGEILSIEVLPNIPIWTFIAIPLLFSVLALIYKLIGG